MVTFRFSYSKKCEIVEIVSSAPLPEETARCLDDVVEAFDDLLSVTADIIRKMREGARKARKIDFWLAIVLISPITGTAFRISRRNTSTAITSLGFTPFHFSALGILEFRVFHICTLCDF
jgi:hypothetical protein